MGERKNVLVETEGENERRGEIERKEREREWRGEREEKRRRKQWVEKGPLNYKGKPNHSYSSFPYDFPDLIPSNNKKKKSYCS